jgi:hypothetical protein
VAVAGDSLGVGRHDEEHLRRFVAARRAGDADAMRRWWGEVMVSLFDRIDGLVATTHRGQLDDQEHELAVELALMRCSTRLIHTFEGTSMGELVNATRTLARGICIDVQRSSMRDRARTRSLDGGWSADGDVPPSTAWEADEAVARFAREEHAADMDAFLTWALPQLRESRRAVVERTFHGAELPEICAELGLTRDNAYQLRSRGLKDLGKLMTQYES